MKAEGASRSFLLFARFVVVACFSTALVASAQAPASKATGFWRPLKNQPQISDIQFTYDGYPQDFPSGAAAPLLMTDGSVMIQNNGYYALDGRIFKLTPDNNGNYVNGTWSELATMPYAEAAASQAVLADGRVLIEGGEYSGNAAGDFYWFLLTNQGAIYDPAANTWTSVNPPSFFVDLYPPRATFAPNPIGDSGNVVLDDGTFMLQDKMSRQGALLNPKTMTWTQTGTSTNPT